MTYPRRNEKPLLPHPEPSVISVNTHFALCFSGVSIKSAMQIAIEARTDDVSENDPEAGGTTHY